MAASATGGMLVYSPGVPINNIFSPNSYVGAMNNFQPLAYLNYLTGQFWPVLASNWTENATAKTLTIYLRKDLYWYNGSATLPFTAWDVYAENYIGNKAFEWWVPYIAQNSTGIKVLNNYTIEFQFSTWSPQIPYYILSTTMATPWYYYKPIVQALQGMSDSEAITYGADNITKFNGVPITWSLSPYYLVKIAEPWMIWDLEPPNLLSAWASIFPYHTWQYWAPEIEMYWGGNAQSINDMMAHDQNYLQGGISQASVAMLNESG
ncbi:MAG: ABC transporter substrate-binding protein, partial [Thermoprotei archaeon]